MASFDKYAPLLREFEGGYVNNPLDKGGPTNGGVTLATFRQYFGSDKTVDDLRRMTDRQWCTVMKSYWDRVQGDKILRQCVAEMLVDWHINSGTAGVKAAQRALGCTADGIVGKKTLAALNSPAAFEKLQDARLVFFVNIVKSRPNQIGMLTGWLRRLLKIKER